MYKYCWAIIITVSFASVWMVAYLSDRVVFLYKTHKSGESPSRKFSLDELEAQHARRKKHAERVCTAHGNQFAKVTKNQLLYSTKYNFCFCSVPKIGSTFWKKVVRILDHGVEQLDTLLVEARMEVHKESRKYRTFDKKDRQCDATMTMTSRDPYSRLFSAYVDKAFLNRWSNLCKEPSFEKYLRQIVKKKNIAFVDIHVMPVSAICDPCVLKPFFIVKQETFDNDVLYVMQRLNISKGEMRAISGMLFQLRADNNVPGIAKTVYIFSNVQQTRTCFRWRFVAERLWKSFQIQGYIDDRVDLPYERFKTEAMFANSSFFIETVLDIIRQYPLTRSMIKEQRKRALNRAFSVISDDLIGEIQKKYATDFRLFNYTTQSPR